MIHRPTYADMQLDAGRRRRLHHMLYDRGPGNGTLMILPIDQGLEHGPVDFLDNSDAEHPLYQFELALQGGFSAIACEIGLANKYFYRYAGRIPLVLKLNGKTGVPSDEDALSPMTASVSDAIRLGADAVGYTLFVGSPRQVEDIQHFKTVRQQAHQAGLPVICWAYPRGRDIDMKGGKQSLYAVAYAARVAQELGADVIKVNFPEGVNQYCPEGYRNLDWDLGQQIYHVYRAAGHSLIIFSGGSKLDTDALLQRVRIGMDKGGSGIIFGRNLWQRPFPEALMLAEQLKSILLEHGYEAWR